MSTYALSLDEKADQFATQSAEHMSPVLHYVKEAYSSYTFEALKPGQRLLVLQVVEHAVRYSVFESVFYKRRAALQALRLAHSFIQIPTLDPFLRGNVAEVIGKLADGYAQSFFE